MTIKYHFNYKYYIYSYKTDRFICRLSRAVVATMYFDIGITLVLFIATPNLPIVKSEISGKYFLKLRFFAFILSRFMATPASYTCTDNPD